MKHFTLKSKVLVAALAITFFFTSCSSSTLIDSYPTGANLYLNGEAVGQTPYEMKDTKIMFSCTSVRIEKDSYNPFYTTICRDEEIDPGAIVGGFFFGFPFIWAFKYKPTHFYRLKPNESGDKEIHENLEQLIEEEELKEKNDGFEN